MARRNKIPVLGERLARVRTFTDKRLSAVDRALPETQQEMPFEEYLARASLRAMNDPQFRREFDKSMQAYHSARSAFRKDGE